MPPVGFDPTISAGEQPKTYALNRAGTGNINIIGHRYLSLFNLNASTSFNFMGVYSKTKINSNSDKASPSFLCYLNQKLLNSMH